MRRLWPALCLVASAAWADGSLRMAVGQQTALPAGKVERLSVADPGVAEATLVAEGERRQILLTALKPGRTDILLWEGGEAPRRLVLEVDEFSPDGFAEEIRDLTKGIEGLVVRIVGDKIVLDGKLLSARDKERLDLIAKAYPRILNLATVDLGRHHGVVAEEIRRRTGSRDLVLEVAGEKALLKGTVPSAADRTAAEQIAQAFFPEVVNRLEVAGELVEIDVTFARVTASDLRQAGQNLPAALSGLLNVTAGGGGQGPVYSASAQTRVFLNALAAKGKATVLASPHLTTASGTEASFHAGGEQGFRVSGTGAADVKFKKHGLLLKVKPTCLADGRIRTWVAVEVSAPAAGSAEGDPAFSTFTTESEVVAAPGEEVVVSGLVESLRARFREKTPLLGDLPILKAFFGASREADDGTRLVLVLSPRRVDPKPSGTPAPASEEGRRTLDDARRGP